MHAAGAGAESRRSCTATSDHAGPFQPHAVARTRLLAYQYYVVMKYLDNLIAWGDSLFQQDTIETINEATLHYVLAANILVGQAPALPPRGRVRPKNFAAAQETGARRDGQRSGRAGRQVPVQPGLPTGKVDNPDAAAAALRHRPPLYFCVPPNDKLLGYWDTVADRLFKIRNCMNIAGRRTAAPLFDPPLDPGMLVKAAAAGIDVGSIVSGLNQPIGPVRSLC